MKNLLKFFFFFPVCFTQSFKVAWRMAKTMKILPLDVEFNYKIKYIPYLFGKKL